MRSRRPSSLTGALHDRRAGIRSRRARSKLAAHRLCARCARQTRAEPREVQIIRSTLTPRTRYAGRCLLWHLLSTDFELVRLAGRVHHDQTVGSYAGVLRPRAADRCGPRGAGRFANRSTRDRKQRARLRAQRECSRVPRSSTSQRVPCSTQQYRSSPELRAIWLVCLASASRQSRGNAARWEGSGGRLDQAAQLAQPVSLTKRRISRFPSIANLSRSAAFQGGATRCRTASKTFKC
jgi:hypothetical protein